MVLFKIIFVGFLIILFSVFWISCNEKYNLLFIFMMTQNFIFVGFLFFLFPVLWVSFSFQNYIFPVFNSSYFHVLQFFSFFWTFRSCLFLSLSTKISLYKHIFISFFFYQSSRFRRFICFGFIYCKPF